MIKVVSQCLRTYCILGKAWLWVSFKRLIWPKHWVAVVGFCAPVWILPWCLVWKKLEWCGYPTVKNFEDRITCFDSIHERDGQMDTAWWDKPRLHSIDSWDWPLTWLTNHHPSVLLHCWLGHLTGKTVSEMTYNVSSGTLNSTIPYHSIAWQKLCILW